MTSVHTSLHRRRAKRQSFRPSTSPLPEAERPPRGLRRSEEGGRRPRGAPAPPTTAAGEGGRFPRLSQPRGAPPRRSPRAATPRRPARLLAAPSPAPRGRPPGRVLRGPLPLLTRPKQGRCPTAGGWAGGKRGDALAGRPGAAAAAGRAGPGKGSEAGWDRTAPPRRGGAAGAHAPAGAHARGRGGGGSASAGAPLSGGWSCGLRPRRPLPQA